LTTKKDIDYYFPLEKYHTFSEFFTPDVAKHEIRMYWEDAQIWFTCSDPEKSRMLRDYDCYTIYSKEQKLDIEFVNRDISIRTRQKKHPVLLPRPKVNRPIECFGPVAVSAMNTLKHRMQSKAIKTCIYLHGQENTGKTSLMRTLTSYLQGSDYLHLDLCAENISNFKIPKGVSKLVVTCDNAESVGASRSSEQGKNGLTEQMLSILDSTRFESFKDQESVLESIVIILVSREISNLDVAMKRSQRVEIPIHLTTVHDSI
jgi:ATPase family associated with various cellular activities (AAA)